MRSTSLKVTLLVLFLQEMREVYGQGKSNFIVEYIRNCDLGTGNPIKVFTTMYMKGDIQYADANATLKVPLDNTQTFNFTAEVLVGRTFMHAFHVPGKGPCTALHRYLGEFVYDLERRAGLVPGLCPIPRGRYHVHDVAVDLNKITFQALPFGRLRLTGTVSNSQSENVGCVICVLKHLEGGYF